MRSTMTVKEAFAAARSRIKMADREFAVLGWEGKEGGSARMLIITIDMDVAIEVSWSGQFKDAFPAAAQGYYPIELEKKDVKMMIGHLVNQLVERMEG